MLKASKTKFVILLTAIMSLSFIIPAVAKTEDVNLPQVTVTASSISDESDPLLITPGVATVLKPEELKGEQKSLPEILKRVPGLHLIESKGHGAYTVASVRGSTAAEVAVFVDGVLMNLGSDAAVDLSTIPVGNIEQIEVYRGYVPARFAGASLGGVINIITKKPTKPGSTLELGIASLETYTTRFSHSTPLGKGNLFVGANWERTNGDFEYLNDNNTPYISSDDYTTRRQNNSYKKGDVLVKWNDDHWQLRAAYKRMDGDLVYQAPGFDKPDSPKGATMDTGQTEFSIGREQENGKLKWNFRLDYLHQDKQYDDPNNVMGAWDEQHNRYKTDKFIATVGGTYAMSDTHLLEFMVDGSNERLNTTGDVVTRFGGQENHRRRVINVQLQDVISIDKSGTLLLTPIVRGNWWDSDGKFSGAVALSKQLGESWDLRATFGNYNRAPNMYELYGDGAFVLPNPELQWERGLSWDVSASWKKTVKNCNLRAVLSYFGRNVDNLIEFVMTNPRYGRYFNIGLAKINGIEFEGSLTNMQWDFNLSATAMKATNESDNYKNGCALPNRPQYELLARVNRRFLKDDKASAFIEWHYQGQQYFDESETICIKPYSTTELGFRYNFSKDKKLVCGIKDIFNQAPDCRMTSAKNGPERMLWYPLQGRTLYASIIWNF